MDPSVFYKGQDGSEPPEEVYCPNITEKIPSLFTMIKIVNIILLILGLVMVRRLKNNRTIEINIEPGSTVSAQTLVSKSNSLVENE